MIACAFVMHVAERSLNRIRTRVVSRQEDNIKARMRSQPLANCFRSMYPVIVGYDVEARAFLCRAPSVNQLQQVDKEPPVFALACQEVERPPRCPLIAAVPGTVGSARLGGSPRL